MITCKNRHRNVALVEALSRCWLRVTACCLIMLTCACEKREHEARPPHPARPALTLALITDLDGVLSPCGCTARAVGGVARIARVISELRAQGPLLVVVAGNTFRDPHGASTAARSSSSARDAQSALEADALVAVLRTLEVDVIAPGPLDQAQAKAQLAALARGAQVSVLHTGGLDIEGLHASGSQLLRRAGDLTLGFVALSPGGRGREDVTQLRKQGARVVIAFQEGDALDGSAADLTVAYGLRGDVSVAMMERTLVVHAGHRAQEFSIVRVWPGHAGSALRLTPGAHPTAPGTATVTHHALDAGLVPLPAVERLVNQLFSRIQDLHGAVTAPAPHPPTHDAYVGARTCAACHTEAYLWWTNTGHARAYHTLQRSGRALDLDCIGCHVTGFEAPGGATLGHLDELGAVGCESCHGPGGRHADNPRDKNGALRRAVPADVCTACHDQDHSDRFDYGARSRALISPAHGARGKR